MPRISIVGGSGYTGGELLRLLLDHPFVEVQQVTSRKHLGEYVYQSHPNLRKRTSLKFSDPEVLSECDILFLALPHGEAQKKIELYAHKAEKIIDLSADFRLRSANTYFRWYKEPHRSPEWLEKFVYGLPELHRQEIKNSLYISGVGCNATASILAILPSFIADLIEKDQPILVEVKVGSSESGAEGNPGTHHPERSGVIRTFSSFGHRHTAEVIQELHLPKVSLTMTSVDIVRGSLATAHLTVKEHTTLKDLWRAYRNFAEVNPFVRVVKEARGIYRVPDPKILAGSNYADVGFEFDEENHHLVATCAIDNLMKGASGTAVQCLNLIQGYPENTALQFPGLHPA